MAGDIRNCANGSGSSLSLPPPLPDRPGPKKRRLLLIYIHGFMGSEASFQDLPAHVHDMLTALLGESHIVYTRIYPRYKSHGEILAAAEQFSAWLSPHETDDLDVVLLGHSLGGILAADVALLERDGQPRHRILGLVNFDVPFLGLHPRVIPTGIGSSMPKKDPAAEVAGEQESLGLEPAFQPPPNPNFDPPWKNDVRRVDRGFFKGMMHFVNKNTDNLSRSIYDRVASSVKFAGCVNNYGELRRRYRRLKELEDAEFSAARVRFVNYYTASTGRFPRPKPGKEDENGDQAEAGPTESPREVTETPDIAKEYKEVPPNKEVPPTTENSAAEEQDLTPGIPGAFKVDEPSDEKKSPTADITDSLSSISLEHKEPVEDKTPLDQGEPPNKQEPSTEKEAFDPKEASNQPLSDSISLTTTESTLSTEDSNPKLRKFILLPSHHWKSDDNSHWTPILMEDMDEVAAHQSMFNPQRPNYDKLIAEVVDRIEQWVQLDLSRRLLQESLD